MLPAKSSKTQRFYDKWIRKRPGEVVAPFSTNSVAIRSMAETGRILGISKQAVHQIERTALMKLRMALKHEHQDL